MHLLFVSSTTVGGSGRSQRELATQLVEAGHDVSFLVDDDAPARFRRWWYEQLSDLAVRVQGRPGSSLVTWLERRPGCRTGRCQLDGFVHETTPIPQNAVGSVLDRLRPDVVVGNSLTRLSWRRTRAECRARATPTILYIREDDSLQHVLPGEEPEALVANAASLATTMELQGLTCHVVPSVIDVERTRTTSSRRAVLVINPIPSRGVDLVWRVAADLPEIPFVVQESWPLSEEDLLAVREKLEELPNVELRRAAPPGPDLYADARVLMVPYRVDNRPRVVAEAQANGIPVVAADLPALAEAVGPGGVLVDAEALDQWRAAIERLFRDEEHYLAVSSRAESHSRRDELRPSAVAAAFEAILETVRAGHRAA